VLYLHPIGPHRNRTNTRKDSIMTTPNVDERTQKLQTELYCKLMKFRNEISNTSGFTPHTIASNRQLLNMAKMRPTKLSTLLKIEDFSEVKAKRFGQEFITMIKTFCEHNSLDADVFPEDEVTLGCDGSKNLRKKGVIMNSVSAHAPASMKAKLDGCKKSTVSVDDQDVLLPGMCGRCGRSSSMGKCEVHHPPHLRIDKGSVTESDGGFKSIFQCIACRQVITNLTHDFSMANSVVVEGPKFCFRGKHISTPLPRLDERRTYKGLINIDRLGNMQPKIEKELNPFSQEHVKILTFNGQCDESFPLTLRHTACNLTTLKIVDTHMMTLHLTEALTPRLTDLELVNVPHECDFKVVVPTLKNISIQFLTPKGKTAVINDMLAAATRLETFDCYKLWVEDELCFASNELEIIDLHRSDSLDGISIWAPNLQKLDLQACYCLDKIKILKEHPKLSKELPVGHKPSTFTVNTLYANISDDARRALKKSGRSLIQDADPAGNPMSETEAENQKTFQKLLKDSETRKTFQKLAQEGVDMSETAENQKKIISRSVHQARPSSRL